MMMGEEPTSGLASRKPFDQPEQPYSPPPAGVAVAAATGRQRHGGGGAHKRSVLLEPGYTAAISFGPALPLSIVISRNFRVRA